MIKKKNYYKYKDYYLYYGLKKDEYYDKLDEYYKDKDWNIQWVSVYGGRRPRYIVLVCKCK